MPQDVPDDFDWVTAQSACSAAALFARLHAQVTEDVARRTRLLQGDEGWTFEINQDGDAFEVWRVVPGFTGSQVAASVRFERAGRRIQIHGDGVEVDITAVAALDAAGVCRLVVGEAMYSDWELRRMALEELFFEELEPPEE